MIDEDLEALKIHGGHHLYDSDDSVNSESGKSDFDEKYEKAKPPPIQIDPSKVICIRAPKHFNFDIEDLDDSQSRFLKVFENRFNNTLVNLHEPSAPVAPSQPSVNPHQVLSSEKLIETKRPKRKIKSNNKQENIKPSTPVAPSPPSGNPQVFSSEKLIETKRSQRKIKSNNEQENIKPSTSVIPSQPKKPEVVISITNLQPLQPQKQTEQKLPSPSQTLDKQQRKLDKPHSPVKTINVKKINPVAGSPLPIRNAQPSRPRHSETSSRAQLLPEVTEADNLCCACCCIN